MTETSAPLEETTALKPALGVGRLFGLVTVLFVTRLPKILLLALPGGLATGGLLYLGIYIGEDYWRDFGVEILLSFLVIAISIGSGLALTAGPMAKAFSSYQRHGRVPVLTCLAKVSRRILPALICAILTAILTMIPIWILVQMSGGRFGAFLATCAVATGMYAIAVFGLSIPAIPVERLGLSALGRSRTLGQGYRWPIAGTCFMFFVTALLIASGIVAGLAFLSRVIMVNWLGLANTFTTVTSIAFVSICVAMMFCTSLIALGLAAIRERLIEIKEPPDIGDMIEVFD